MNAHAFSLPRSPFGIIRHLRNKAGAKEARALMGADRPELDDPHADEHFTMLDGEPVTFRRFNEIMAQHFAGQLDDAHEASVQSTARLSE